MFNSIGVSIIIACSIYICNLINNSILFFNFREAEKDFIFLLGANSLRAIQLKYRQ